MALLLACSGEQQPIESEAINPLPINTSKATWQFEAIRDRIVVEQCEKLQDPDAFQPNALVLD
jgi:hypothetical protein